MATVYKAPIEAPKVDYRGDWQKQESDYMEAVAALARGNATNDPRPELLGRVYRTPIADGYAQYIVWRTKPLQLVWLELGDAWSAPVALTRGLKVKDLEAAFRFDDFWQKGADDHETYIASLPLGTIVHYNNGFSQFIRCKRVEGEKGKRLLPLAMVGNWHDHDLPHRNRDGSVSLGYHAKQILEGEAFEPNFGSIWEAKDADGKAWMMRGLTAEGTAHLNDIGKARFNEQRYTAPFDPTTAEAIDLTPPDLEGEAVDIAPLEQRRLAIRKLLEETPEQSVVAYESLLDRVIQLASA